MAKNCKIKFNRDRKLRNEEKNLLRREGKLTDYISGIGFRNVRSQGRKE